MAHPNQQAQPPQLGTDILAGIALVLGAVEAIRQAQRRETSGAPPTSSPSSGGVVIEDMSPEQEAAEREADKPGAAKPTDETMGEADGQTRSGKRKQRPSDKAEYRAWLARTEAFAADLEALGVRYSDSTPRCPATPRCGPWRCCSSSGRGGLWSSSWTCCAATSCEGYQT
jgi:hypothetical protein